jgi:hypothetical protein
MFRLSIEMMAMWNLSRFGIADIGNALDIDGHLWMTIEKER